MRESILSDGINVSKRKRKEQLQDKVNGGESVPRRFFEGLRTRPGRTLFLGIFAIAGCGIFVNALFLQSERHPAPFFAKTIVPAKPSRAADVQKQTAKYRSSSERTAVARSNHAKKIASIEALVKTHESILPPAGNAVAPYDGGKHASPVNSVKRIGPEKNGRFDRNDTERGSRRAPGPAHDLIGSIIRKEKTAVRPRPPADIPGQRSIKGRTQSTILGGEASAAKKRIEAMQRALVKLGYPISVDGISGPATQAALQHFQRRNRLPLTQNAQGRTLQVLASRARVAIP